MVFERLSSYPRELLYSSEGRALRGLGGERQASASTSGFGFGNEEDDVEVGVLSADFNV